MLIKGFWTFLRAFNAEFCSVLLEPEIAACARHACLWYLPHQLELKGWTLSLAFCCVFFAFCPAMNPVPPTACGFVLLSHLGWGSGEAPLSHSVLSMSRGNGICDFVTSRELTQSPNDENSFWLSGLVLCYFFCSEGNCVILWECWLILLMQKAEKS